VKETVTYNYKEANKMSKSCVDRINSFHSLRAKYLKDTFCIHPFPHSGNIGVPIKLLFEAEGMKVTAEVRWHGYRRSLSNHLFRLLYIFHRSFLF
jgi:small nuclear ribonucleoprotein (snRNP)-like protein